MNATIEHEIKLEASRGEGRHTDRETRRADKGQTREESAGNTKNKLREIERTWKLELLSATASVEQRNAAAM
jgi:hypothetical protein